VIAPSDLVGWHGDLPDFNVPADVSEWPLRPLGDRFEPARFRVLGRDGFYRPTINVRDGAVVLFDAALPEVDFAALTADLGEPEERHDYAFGTLAVDDGEWIYARRGITVFVNTDPDRVLHVALYAPTSAADYAERLRPHLEKTLRPRV
jgi:hypothetical protein